MKARANTCTNHPNRVTNLRCQRCSILYCEECLTQYQGQSLCAICIGELEEAERLRQEARKPFWQRWKREEVLPKFLIATIFFGIIGGIMVLVAQQLSTQQLEGNEYARIIMATRLQMNLPVNLASIGWGTGIKALNSEQPGYEARKLLDGIASPELPGWRSAGTVFPQEFIISLVEPYNPVGVNTIVFLMPSDAPKETWVREVEVQHAEREEGPWTTIGYWMLLPDEEQQTFTFEQVAVRNFVRLRILANQGSADYTSLGEFELQLVQRP